MKFPSKLLPAMLILSMSLLPACANLGAGMSSTGPGAGISAAEIAKQADGVAAALETLPKAPDKDVQSKVAGYATWAAFLARSAAVVVGAVGK
jgi:hypothetical protein